MESLLYFASRFVALLDGHAMCTTVQCTNVRCETRRPDVELGDADPRQTDTAKRGRITASSDGIGLPHDNYNGVAETAWRVVCVVWPE